ncbi:MAG: DUF1223 domain-containing protein [Alphaproteobacteria bacterium]|nr:DUF1223 domain-containing protein [Alphaproteobacteria bacterium]
MTRRATVVAFAVLAAAATAAMAGESRPVVVELYTSQGCSSCPPADLLMGKLVQRKDVIGMSLPITYWDMLGWKDTLATEANTRRQKAYAAAMGHGGVYTPQIIVDGTRDVAGGRDEAVVEAVNAAVESRDRATDAAMLGNAAFSPSTEDVRSRDWSVPVSLMNTARHLRVAIGRAPELARKEHIDATVWLFRLRSSATVRIGRGENAGRTMTYHNVVSDIRDVGRWRGEAVALDVAPADPKAPPHDGVVVLVQQGGYGRVIGAAYLGQTPYYAQQ